jgi:hypothetical protein
VRHHLAGRAEPLDNGKPVRLLDQYPLAVQLRVVGPDDQANRDATNELVLLAREQNKLITTGIRTLADQLDDLSLATAGPAPLVDLLPSARRSAACRSRPSRSSASTDLHSCSFEPRPASRRDRSNRPQQANMRRPSVLQSLARRKLSWARASKCVRAPAVAARYSPTTVPGRRGRGRSAPAEQVAGPSGRY